jgi:hypothetical protein
MKFLANKYRLLKRLLLHIKTTFVGGWTSPKGGIDAGNANAPEMGIQGARRSKKQRGSKE